MSKKTTHQILLFTSAILVLIAVGCQGTGGPDPVAELENGLKNMKAASTEFEQALAEVVDKETALAAKPKLKAATAAMVTAAEPLEIAMGTKSRLALSIKKEVVDFRRAQKDLIDQHIRRIKRIPEAEDILKEYLDKT